MDFVVGMNREIGDSAAIEFSAAFYDALGAGESVEFAFALRSQRNSSRRDT